ncbi:MAG: DUF4401 domain-containing protein [Gemmatimonadaceae bacterium]
MRRSVADVLARLKSEGLATDAADAPARAALDDELRDYLPWYVRAAVGLGAWLATAFFLGFLLFFLDLDESLPRIGTGLAFLVFAVWQRPRTTSEFLRHAAVAVSLAGFGLVIAGMWEELDSRVTSAIVVVMSTALIRLMPDRAFRFFAALAMTIAIYLLIMDERSLRGFELATLVTVMLAGLVWRWRLDERSNDVDEMLRPVGYALIVALFGALLVGMSTHLGRLSFDTGRWLVVGRLTTIGITVALVALVWKIIDEQGQSFNTGSSVAALLGVVALGASTMSTPGIIGGAAVLTLAFDRRDKVLLGMAVVFLLCFGSVYYYSLHLTLLEKSGVLAGSGALLLAIRHRLARA